MKSRWLKRVSIFLAFTSIVTAILLHVYVTWRIEHRQPCSESVFGSGYRPEAVFQHMTCRLWETESDDYYYAIIFGHAHFEPFMPTLTYAFNYDKDRGGELVVNGKVVEYSHEKRILALDPFGELQEITLSEADMKIVGTHQCDQIWESIVLQRLYQFTGRTNNGKRVGPWTCSDMDGNKAYEGDFLEDRRDGKWTYYYRSGGVRAILHYQNGTRHGKWTYFGEDGAQTDVLTWNNDIPLERSVGHYGMCFSEVCHPKAKIVERHED